jgi:hypothetical protein
VGGKCTFKKNFLSKSAVKDNSSLLKFQKFIGGIDPTINLFLKEEGFLTLYSE